jgi:hypothetical protein
MTFEYKREYTEEQISAKVTPVNHQGEFLIADTPDKEYWFKRDGHYWKLDHTWGHFILTKAKGVK